MRVKNPVFSLKTVHYKHKEMNPEKVACFKVRISDNLILYVDVLLLNAGNDGILVCQIYSTANSV